MDSTEPRRQSNGERRFIMEEKNRSLLKRPGVNLPWELQKQRIPSLSGDEKIVREVWEHIDKLAWTFIWHVLVSF
jgi:hypothetical protein